MLIYETCNTYQLVHVYKLRVGTKISCHKCSIICLQRTFRFQFLSWVCIMHCITPHKIHQLHCGFHLHHNPITRLAWNIRIWGRYNTHCDGFCPAHFFGFFRLEICVWQCAKVQAHTLPYSWQLAFLSYISTTVSMLSMWKYVSNPTFSATYELSTVAVVLGVEAAFPVAHHDWYYQLHDLLTILYVHWDSYMFYRWNVLLAHVARNASLSQHHLLCASTAIVARIYYEAGRRSRCQHYYLPPSAWMYAYPSWRAPLVTWPLQSRHVDNCT